MKTRILIGVILAIVLWITPSFAVDLPDAWHLFVYSARLLPIEKSFTAEDMKTGAFKTDAAYDRVLAYRQELVQACIDATDDRSERYICVKVARFESFYREDVGRCQIKGKAGDMGAWQIVPRNDAESARLCKSLVEDARFHLERVRESRAACRHLPKWDQLALYARGDCASDEGRALSRHRFPTDSEIKKLELERW